MVALWPTGGAPHCTAAKGAGQRYALVPFWPAALPVPWPLLLLLALLPWLVLPQLVAGCWMYLAAWGAACAARKGNCSGSEGAEECTTESGRRRPTCGG